MRPSGRVRIAGVAVACAVAVVVHAFSDPNGVLAEGTYLGVLVGASIGAWIGALRAPSGERLVARLIAAGVTLTALGDLLWFALSLADVEPDVSVADVPWFASYVALCGAVWLVLQRNRRDRRGAVDLDFLIDVVTIVAVTGLVFWHFSVEAILHDDGLPAAVRVVWAAYPVADAVLLALVVRMLLSPTDRTGLPKSFALGALLWLAADVAYLESPAGRTVNVVMDAAWMIGPVLIARAAWRVSSPPPSPPVSSALGGRVAQLTIVVGPFLLLPSLEVIADLRGEPTHPHFLLVGTAVLIALALVRTARLMRSEERARLDVEEARDAAMEASRAKSMFLANISHEIRTPLTTVLASVEMLESTPLSDAQLAMVEKANRSGERLRALVEEILDLSRIEAGHTTLRARDFELDVLVADLADFYLLRAAQAGIEFRWRLDPAVPGVVTGDPDRLSQVVTNVLDNAFKFTHEGHVDLTVRVADDGDPATQGSVEFVVSDTGIGIPDDQQDRVFETFQQVDGSPTRRYGGSGLGLAICRELTRLMGGTITLHSELGTGSTFVVRVPLPEAEEGEELQVVAAGSSDQRAGRIRPRTSPSPMRPRAPGAE